MGREGKGGKGRGNRWWRQLNLGGGRDGKEGEGRGREGNRWWRRLNLISLAGGEESGREERGGKRRRKGDKNLVETVELGRVG